MTHQLDWMRGDRIDLYDLRVRDDALSDTARVEIMEGQEDASEREWP
jgi:hypothetical protein